jgi:ubiquinone/menaquinone biosynthesis C-methylase UbiE
MADAAQERTLAANRAVHGALVESGDYQKSPHFRPENQQKVRALLQQLVAPLSKERAIDFGCGTGFMIDLMHDQFAEIHGVDITRAMMDRVDLSPGNIQLHEARAEQTPFPETHFDFATAYSFMDHLHAVEPFLREVHRVLKPGGVFYAGLNPHRAYILAMEAAASETEPTEIIAREIKGALHNGEHYAEHYGLDATTLEQAEPIKSVQKGFDPHEIRDLSRTIGFADCRIVHEWFLGQGTVMHQQSFAAAESMDRHLQSILPASAPLYKYLTIILTR